MQDNFTVCATVEVASKLCHFHMSYKGALTCDTAFGKSLMVCAMHLDIVCLQLNMQAMLWVYRVKRVATQVHEKGFDFVMKKSTPGEQPRLLWLL